MNWLTIKHPLSPRLINITARQSEKILSKGKSHTVLSVAALSFILILAGSLAGMLLAAVAIFDVAMDFIKKNSPSDAHTSTSHVEKEPEGNGFRFDDPSS